MLKHRHFSVKIKQQNAGTKSKSFSQENGQYCVCAKDFIDKIVDLSNKRSSQVSTVFFGSLCVYKQSSFLCKHRSN